MKIVIKSPPRYNYSYKWDENPFINNIIIIYSTYLIIKREMKKNENRN